MLTVGYSPANEVSLRSFDEAPLAYILSLSKKKEREDQPPALLALVLVENYLVAEDFVHINFRQACPDLIEEGFDLLFGRILEPWVCVLHRVYKPSLSFYLWWSGWRLATS